LAWPVIDTPPVT